MIYLGTVDDKSIEYPYGSKQLSKLDTQRLILHHLLFNSEPLLLEEGFILASSESVNPSPSSRFLVDIIKAGLLKVATCSGDMRLYAQQRKNNKYKGPPDNKLGLDYVSDLQAACVQANAFVEYSSSYVDELAFGRFTNKLKDGSLEPLFEVGMFELPKEIVDIYEHIYTKGNEGKQWTARAAWEQTMSLVCQARPEMIHPFMCVANRERQILRAATIAKENNISISVETGFEVDEHDIAKASKPQIKEIINKDQLYFPRVDIELLVKHSKKFIKALGDPNGVLANYRNAYLSQLYHHNISPDFNQLERLAQNYEIEIYNAIGENRIEDDLALSVMGTMATGTLIGGTIAALWSSLKNKNKVPAYFEDEPIDTGRRKFLKHACLGSLLSALYVLDNQNSNLIAKGIRTARVITHADVGDQFMQYYSNIGRSHQILQVDANSMRAIGF